MRNMMYFGDKTCAPCRRIKKEFVDNTILPNVEQEQVSVIICNDNPQIAKKFHIKRIPTIVLSENDEEIRRYEGVVPNGDKIVDWLTGWTNDIY